ncbi:MAG: alpha/beta hydrolase, partial [Oscillospiraceae bacterium]|nr:alpha/beta hydrolase [Oscillospiraceae bacterium]
MRQFEEEYILINGIHHFLLHYPKAAGTPVLLYLHGGPGMFESLFAYKLDTLWGDMFAQVHWDQRGAGKTLRRNGKTGLPETTGQMLADLHGIVEYLRQKYQTDRIVLLGHSWGSVLGSLYALQHPENVLAYIGAGQVISVMENERIGYQQTLEMARKRGAQKHIRALEKLGEYPPEDPEALLKLLPRMRKIQEAYDNGPVSGAGLGDMLKVIQGSPSFQWGDLVSFIRFMQVNRPLQLEMLTFDLDRLSLSYQTPVHYILGEADNITPPPLCQDYFDRIS